MPDKTCQNCGTELQIESICSQCNQAISQTCPACGYATLERIHLDCTLGLEMVIQSRQQLPKEKVEAQ